MSNEAPAQAAIQTQPATEAGSAIETRILVLAPTGNDARLTAGFLAANGLVAEPCASIGQLCEEAAKGCGVIILADETLGENAVEPLIALFSAQPSWSDLPVVLITRGGETDRAQIRRLNMFGPAGNVTVLERPFRPSTLVRTVETALRSRQRQYQGRAMLMELSDARARIEATLGVADVGTWNWDLTTDLVLADANMARIFSMPTADTAGSSSRKYFEKVHVEDRDGILAARALAMASEGGQYESDYRVRQRDGSLRWVTSRGRLERDANGQPVRFQGVVIDITERKAAEERERRLAREAMAANAKFRAVFEQFSVFAGIMTVDGVLIEANHLWLDHCGYKRAEAIGRLFWETPWWRGSAEVREKIRAGCAQAAKGEAYREVLPYWIADGTERIVDFGLSPIVDDRGNLIFLHPTGVDITERKRTEEALVQANRAKDDFLAALSHELRTPLNPALLIASEASDNYSLPESERLKFEAIRKNIELEARLIDDLLDLTRITRGKITLHHERVDIHELLREAIATVKGERVEKKIRIVTNLNANSFAIDGDAVRLQQIFWNVLKNAAKFTPEGGEIRVETSAAPGNQLEIRIADTGIGMTPEELERVFSPFVQGNHIVKGGAHRFGGLGLGLAISKTLVELHSGKITAESAGPNQGSTFTIQVPLAEVGSSTEPTAAETKRSALATSNRDHSTMSILLVEDHEMTRTVLTHLLSRRNYRVTAADSVAGAREAARGQRFDLLISDIGLPDGDGNSLMNELHESYGMKGIALTGYGTEQDIARGQAAGFLTHLIKPVHINALESALSAVKNQI